jgi:hypothetical protein
VANSGSPAQPVPLFAGCVFLVIGLALLFENWGTIKLTTSDFVPLLIVAVGIGAIALAVSRLLPGRR